MATNQNLTPLSLPASGDLSSYQFHIVTLDTDGKVALATDADSTTAPPMTVLLNKPTAEDQAAEIANPGAIVKVVCGGTINESDAVTCDTSGHAVATTTAGDKCIGRAVTAGAENALAEVWIQMFMFEGS